jgi:ubiquinone/menaquinone biosynthesis C-methylase UbiE
MEQIRKPFQGVFNIVRFNWHFYVLSIVFLLGLLFFMPVMPAYFYPYLLILFVSVLGTTLISLLVSFYVYDISDLYKLAWIPDNDSNGTIVNINAGFDETSVLLKAKFRHAELIILDFYDPKKHTEISIKRARKAYPPYPNTQQIATSNLKLQDNSVDKIFVIFAAHEIRNDVERVVFFNELKRILKPNGQIFVTEHLRDTANFCAYNIGFFHFLSLQNWYNTFKTTNLSIKNEQKITPFITTFTLEKHGIAS